MKVLLNFQIILFQKQDTISDFVDEIYPNIESNFLNDNYLSRRPFLSPKNDGVDEINEIVLNKIPGEEFTYTSRDTVVESK